VEIVHWMIAQPPKQRSLCLWLKCWIDDRRP
jgi:hypothetical protein